MKHFLALVVLSTLAGCDGQDAGPQACNAEHITTSAQTGNTGLTLEPSAGAFLTFEDIESVYIDTEQCTGISAIGPTVHFESFARLGLGENGPRGAYSAESHLVTVNSDPPPEGITNDCSLQRQVLRHEFVHYLLDTSGAGAENANHSSPLFAKCGQIVTGA